MEPLLLSIGLIDTVLVLGLLVVVLARRPAPSVGTASIESALREEVRASGTGVRDDLTRQRGELGDQLAREREERQSAQRDLRQDLTRSHTELLERLSKEAAIAREAESALRTAVNDRLLALQAANQAQLDQVRETVGEKLQDRIERLTTANADKHVELQSLLVKELEKLRRGNEEKLEQMRETVDEKLQGTLEKRLGESFALVSTRLEEVQKGLGEMQSLASDVGGLKRVLTNVKNRGGWGEVQLSRQLEDILTREQYEENVALTPGSGERVEFAVRLPGREDDSVVYLAIDSKFPQEDYERLLSAHEGDDKAAIDEAGRALERAILEQAKTIAGKYIDPPHTTDFAILYLPTEGLFAEVVRRPGLASRLQVQHRILITGPTTLMSLLNSLQMGFRTLAIEKRSSEVWKVLAAAKSEFGKYGQVWTKLEKQLQTAQNTVTEAGRRTRAVERQLREVESLESPTAGEVSPADLLDELDSIVEQGAQIDPLLASGLTVELSEDIVDASSA